MAVSVTCDSTARYSSRCPTDKFTGLFVSDVTYLPYFRGFFSELFVATLAILPKLEVLTRVYIYCRPNMQCCGVRLASPRAKFSAGTPNEAGVLQL